MIKITDALEAGSTTFQAKPGEAVGFVFPVYYYTVNDVVAEFIEKLTLEHAGYVYAVVTCGASICCTGGELKKRLARKSAIGM